MIDRKKGGWGKRKVKITSSGAFMSKRHPSKKAKKKGRM